MRTASYFFLWIVLGLLLGGLPAALPAQENFIVERNVDVPMRDGVILRADIFRPRGEGRFPVLVYRTPYGKDAAQTAYKTFEKAVARGYAVVVQDVRGRYHSDGEFNPYRNEARDGYDTIEWSARQPWSNGEVGTIGLSYPGAVQWLAAMEAPPHLKAMAPAMTFSTPRNFFYSGGVFDLSWLSWTWNNIAPDIRAKKNLAGPRTYAEAGASWTSEQSRMESFLPLAALPDLKDVAPWYYEWLQHPATDPWWDWAELRGKYDRVDAAVLNLSGWNDEAYGPEGAITNFQGLVAARRGKKDFAARLVIGPWMHGVGNTGRTKFGERDFGAAAAIDYDEVVMRFLDHYLKGVANGVEREPPVRYFVMGENAWHQDRSWPPASFPKVLFFAGPADRDTAGALRPRPARESRSTSRFVSDPANPVRDPFGDALGGHDYRALAGRDDVLLFDSAPFTRDVEVTGNIRAEIFLSSDAPDLDLWVRLLDVAPDGTAYNLMSPGTDVLRASYRNGAQREQLEPGVVYALKLDRMVTANLFLRGHRLRVQISGAFAPHYSVNLQTGQLETDSSKSRVANITIYHDRTHATRLIVPVVGSAAGIADAALGKPPAGPGTKPVARRGQMPPPR
jgi:putative CocE/NonD family hydrolase